MTTALIILVSILYLKWVVFVLSLPVIRLIQSRAAKKFAVGGGTEEESRSISREPVPVKQRNPVRRLLSECKRYVWGYMRWANFQTGLIPSHHIRDFLYRHVWLVDMEKNVIIYFGAEIRAPHRLHIGKGSIIGDNCLLDARNGIEIGENVNFSSDICIYTEQHDHRDAYFRCNSDRSFRVKIGDRAWIGPNVTILHSVTIGEGAVVAAGAVVTKDIEPYTLAGGIPAKKIGDRTRDLRYELDGRYSPFA